MALITVRTDAEQFSYRFVPETHECVSLETGQSIALPTEKILRLKEQVHPFNSLNAFRVTLGMACNQSCRYCIQQEHGHRGKIYTKADAARFLPGFLYLLDAAGQARDAKPAVNFIGGEPLLHWDALRFIAEGIRSVRPDAHISFITNGTLLDGSRVKYCLDHGLEIILSHDGPGQALRGRDPLAPHSESYAALLLYSRESANPLTVNPVLTRDNDDIGVVYDYLCNRLHRRVRISECFPVRGLHGCADSLAMSDEQIFGRWLPAAIHCLRTRPLEDFPLFRDLYYALLYNIVTGTPAYPRGRCTAYADKPFAVDMEGRCLLCHAETPTYRFPRKRDGADTVNAVMTLDDMMRENMSMDDIAARFRAARHLEDWRDMPRCRDCVSLNACWGCCPKEAGADLESGCAVNYAVGLVPLNLMFHMMHKNVIGMDIQPEADA